MNSVPEVSGHPALRRREAVSSGGETVPIPDHPVKWRDENWRTTPGAPPCGRDSDSAAREFGDEKP